MGDDKFESPLVGLRTNEESENEESENEETEFEEDGKDILNKYVEIGAAPYKILKFAEKRGLIPFVKVSNETAYLAEYMELLTEAEKLMEIDNKEGFAAFIKEKEEKIRLLSEEALLEAVCKANAIGCATVLLNSGFKLDLNRNFDEPVYLPLYTAVSKLNYGLTNLFLEKGAKPHMTHRGTPLNVALDALSVHEYVKDWTTDKSIFKLFYLLCLPELKEGLDTIRLLVSRAQQDEVLRLCFKLIEFGSIFKFTVLVWAAKDKLLVSSPNGGLESTPIGEYILAGLRQESEKELSFLQCEDRLLEPECERRAILMAAYNAVKALRASLPVLDRYCESDGFKTTPKHEVPFDIARALVIETKLVLERSDVFCDDIKCLKPMFFGSAKSQEVSQQLNYKKLKALQRENPRIRTHIDDSIPATSSSWLIQSTLKKPSSSSFHAVRGIRYEINKPLSTSSSHQVRTTFRAINYNFNKPLVNQLCKIVQVKQSKDLASTAAARVKVWAPLIWVAKRSIR